MNLTPRFPQRVLVTVIAVIGLSICTIAMITVGITLLYLVIWFVLHVLGILLDILPM